MRMTAKRRADLQRANLLVKGLILRVKHSKDPDRIKSDLCEALLRYGIWLADGVQ